MELEEFEQIHGILLASSGLPTSLYPELHHKLLNEVFDGGSFFKIQECEDGKQRRLVLSADSLGKESNVFLVDHAWSFRLADARKQLESVPGLAERMAKLMCVYGETEPEQEASSDTNVEKLVMDVAGTRWLELDDLGIDDAKLESLDIASKFPNLIALSLWGNQLESPDAVLKVLSCLHSLKALWLNGNPVASNDKLLEMILEICPELEIYNSKFIGDFGQWAMGFCCGIYGPDKPASDVADTSLFEEIEEVDLSNRGIEMLPTKGFNPATLPNLKHVTLRGNPLNTVSTSSLVHTLRSFPLLKSLEVDIPGPIGDNALRIVDELPNLVMLNKVPVDKVINEEKEFRDGNLKQRFPVWSPDEPLAERVLRAMWSYIMTYRLADEEKLDETPIWYVMDELGSAMRHSGDFNFKVAPFMFLQDGTMNSAVSYTLMWPTKDIHSCDECTRDYLFGITEKQQRSVRLSVRYHTPSGFYEKAYEAHHQKRPLKKSFNHGTATKPLNVDERPITVYSDIPQITDFLTRPEFTLIEDPSKADIVWSAWQIDEETRKTFGLRNDQYFNQFPYESCLVMKHHLAETMRQAYGAPQWLPTTYDLETQLAALIGDFNAREERNDDNLWILKPWNMARTIDTSITRYLPAIIRHLETGPKICQKYIERPALFHGKKFDLRFIVLVRSLQPLELFLCDVFWARFALNDYTLDEKSLSEYETHFTVMNYRNKMNHINTHEFVPLFEEEHKVKWFDIHTRVRTMLREVFQAAYAVQPEMQSPMSRAIYGVDVMLDATFQPKLLEVTYCPDCTRACKYDVKKVIGDQSIMKGKDFFNVVFGCLFLNETQDVTPL